MTIPEDFIESEIKRILAILDKQCELFSVGKDLTPEEIATSRVEPEVVKEREPNHVNG